MERQFKITEDFRQECFKNLKFESTNLELQLTQNSIHVANHIVKCTRLGKDALKAKTNLEKVRADKRIYYAHEHDVVPDNEKELQAFIDRDDEVVKAQELYDEISLELKEMEVITAEQKGLAWNIKSYIEWQKFRNGQ